MQEYVDFLGKQPPYDRLEPDDLQRLARTVEVEFFAPGATIVRAEEPRLDHLYVVRTGGAHVVDRGQVVDELGPGDTFGQVSVLSGLPPAVSVVARSETLCYRMPDPRTVVAAPERLTFAQDRSTASRRRLVSASTDRATRPVAELMRMPTWVDPDTPIAVAARLMTEANQSCVLYRTPEGVGIMTDSDCRRRVATGDVPPGAPVGAIGTVPAREVSVTTTAAESFLEMVTHGVHHMVVTDARGTPVGVARVFDLSSAEIRDPLVVRRAIDDATDLAALAEACALLPPTAVELADAGVPALRVGALLGAMIEAVVERCVSFEPELARAETSWLVLGSLARHEPLPASDVDTALVWSAPEGAPEPDRDGLLAAAERVIESFERCGLRRCVDGANASNSLFNRSHPAWLAAIGHWVESPDGPGALLLSSIVCDSRPLTGLPLGRSLTAALETDRTSPAFLTRMLREALALRPPTGFVREFVVEAGGDHRGELDLKRRGLGPVVALGRWLALAADVPSQSTQDRLRAGAEAGLLSSDEAQSLRGAHEEMFELLFDREIEALRDGRLPSTYLRPASLDSLTRRHLRESFRAIASVQGKLEGEWVWRLH